ncbi:MAG TPA: gluconokinase, GntK/IdnK-type [Polyangiaceae bacterium]|nr:gluconokinase, GntK/IdnK-type [Polyangiaceae bacterium]
MTDVGEAPPTDASSDEAANAAANEAVIGPTHAPSSPTAVVVMGPSGAGKSTLGEALATAWGARFVDADAHHPPSNVAKMRRGEALDEADRAPWLARLSTLLDAEPGRVVLACSALRREHRKALGVDGIQRRLVFLEVEPATLARRLEERRGHFAGRALLDSQLATLEVPTSEERVLHLNGEVPLDQLVSTTLAWLA